MNILIIDNMSSCNELKGKLHENSFKSVFCYTHYEKAVQFINDDSPDVVIINSKFFNNSEFPEISKTKMREFCADFIIISESPTIQEAVKFIKNGAWDYYAKPLNINELVRSLYEIKNQKHCHNIFFKNKNCRDIPYEFRNFRTICKKMKDLIHAAHHAAQYKYTILITGETGTGKEIFAQAIHEASHQKKNEFIALNVNAIPHGLFESTLFGHKKGSFTHAVNDHSGFLESAHDGTLFLDEIGDLGAAEQIKLLRVIEKKEYYRIGEMDRKRSNFRLITATNKNLQIEIEKGTFRKDLYYRLAEYEIHLPPLRERDNDIVFLAYGILNDLNTEYQCTCSLSEDALHYLLSIPLHGNFRELQNIIKQGFLKTTDSVIKSSDLKKPAADKHLIKIDDIKKKHIKNVVSCYSTQKEAAEALGITYRQLYNYMKKYNITNVSTSGKNNILSDSEFIHQDV